MPRLSLAPDKRREKERRKDNIVSVLVRVSIASLCQFIRRYSSNCSIFIYKMLLKFADKTFFKP